MAAEPFFFPTVLFVVCLVVLFVCCFGSVWFSDSGSHYIPQTGLEHRILLP
jgi:hypothetical protein